MSTVLFVCRENSFRSILAEALFNAHAPRGWIAESAGIRPGEGVSSTAVELLRDIGVEPSRTEPRPLTEELTDKAARIVTFGCLPDLSPGARERAEDWTIPRTHGRPPSERVAAREEILRRVLALIARLPASS